MAIPQLVIETIATSAAVCACATGGVYIAFSTMVMPALNGRTAGEAVSSMQRINVLALRPPFMVLFFGGAVAAAVAGVAQVAAWLSDPPGVLRLTGAVLSLASFGTTLAVNVPLNNALARGTGAGNREVWRAFEGPWTRANTVRGLFALAGAAALAGSLGR